MDDREFRITDARGGAAIPVRVVTGAEYTELVGRTAEGAMRVRLVASPAGDDAANSELVGFLADLLGIAPDRIEIVAGSRQRDKLISVEDLSVEEVDARLGLA
jgi:uncharacterized protein